tara:strand:+ start:486 stop:875 length:390 start_codon:yes stop_codon:yes gene_type:complete
VISVPAPCSPLYEFHGEIQVNASTQGDAQQSIFLRYDPSALSFSEKIGFAVAAEIPETAASMFPLASRARLPDTQLLKASTVTPVDSWNEKLAPTVPRSVSARTVAVPALTKVVTPSESIVAIEGSLVE